MATAAVTYPAVPFRRTVGESIRLYVKETRYEFLKLMRTKTFTLSIIGFPVMFYVLFGIANKGNTIDGMDAAKYYLASYCSFGMIGAALFGIGVGLSSERGLGWLELKRSSPMPAMAYLIAKCFAAQVFGLIIVAVLTAIGIAFGGVHVTATEFAMMLGMTLAGVIPFATMGLLIALLVPANAASGVVNLVYLPMSFMSGLWIPINYLPRFLKPVAPYLPAFHLTQLMETIFGYQQKSSIAANHWYGLAGFSLIMLGTSWAVFHSAEQDA